MALPSQSNRSPDGSDEDQPSREAFGLRLVQFWVPDVSSPEFRDEARRQSLAVANSPHEEEDQAFIDAISTWGDE